jgi:hypothetical protein
MNPNVKPSEDAVLADAIDPQSLAPGDLSTGWISMAMFGAIQAIIMVGALGAAATVDAKLEQATSSAGAGAKDVTDKAITQLTKVGADDNKQAIINCRAEELDVNGDFTHVRLTITVAAAASEVSGAILGHYARYPQAAVASVDEVVG